MTTLLARRQQFHQTQLIEHIVPGQPRVSATLHQMTSFFVLKGSDPVTASHQAFAAMYGQVQRHAAMLSFVEAFKVMGLVFLCMVPLVLLLKDPKKRGASPSAKQKIADTEEEEQPELMHV
jgi:DHA2 family multidrug resistance protein